MFLHIILPGSVIDPDFVKNIEREVYNVLKDCGVMTIYIITMTQCWFNVVISG